MAAIYVHRVGNQTSSDRRYANNDNFVTNTFAHNTFASSSFQSGFEPDIPLVSRQHSLLTRSLVRRGIPLPPIGRFSLLKSNLRPSVRVGSSRCVGVSVCFLLLGGNLSDNSNSPNQMTLVRKGNTNKTRLSKEIKRERKCLFCLDCSFILIRYVGFRFVTTTKAILVLGIRGYNFKKNTTRVKQKGKCCGNESFFCEANSVDCVVWCGLFGLWLVSVVRCCLLL